MKYYKTINYINNVWKSDGKSWWFWDSKSRIWALWAFGPTPRYDGFSIRYDDSSPIEISEQQVFIELL